MINKNKNPSLNFFPWKRKRDTKQGAFTLVELIVVITILAILSTIWFVSYSSYLAWARDWNRIAQLKAISEWLHLYWTDHSLPSPDETSVDIMNWWTKIATQWYVWKNVLETITYSTEWIDPKDKIYFSYYLTKNKKYFQLMWWLEEDNQYLNSSTFGIDYANRFPTVFWDKLWILTTTDNIPLQESTWSIDISNVWTLEYIAHLKDWDSFSWTWTTFQVLEYLSEEWWRGWSVDDNSLTYVDLDAQIPENYPWCDTADITVWTVTIAACNVWTNIAATSSGDTIWYWDYIQFGKSDNSWVNWTELDNYDWNAPGWTDLGSANYWWVIEDNKTTITYDTSIYTDKLKMQWPCADYYHVPTNKEWVALITAASVTNWDTAYSELKLPTAGYRYWSNGNMSSEGSDGSYWASSPTGIYGYRWSFDSTNFNPSNMSARSNGLSVRCFKN